MVAVLSPNPATSDLPFRHPMTSMKGSTAVFWSTSLFVAMMAWQITLRSALTMDELHTLLVARVLASGEFVSFFIGSVSRYEGGSWLVCWPVSWMLRLGAWGSAATCWTAGLISLGTVSLGSLWLSRHFGARAALCFGPLLAFCAPEFVHYSYRAWGSLAEALIVYPLAALAYEGWQRRGRTLRGAVGLGVLLAMAIILSYLHMATALLFVVLQWLERAGRPLFRVATETLVVATTAVVSFALWLWTAVPHLDEALTVRSGTPIQETIPSLVLVRLDRVLLHLPQAWMGQHLDRSLLPMLMGVGLSVLSVVCVITAWRRGGKARWLSCLWLMLLPPLSVGHELAELPDVLRYYLPLLMCSLALIAVAGRAQSLLALTLGLVMWLPQGLPIPYQNPTHAYLELGSNALYRFAAEPHEKFHLLVEHVPDRYRPWFAFGYGLDAGTRYARDTRSMEVALDTWLEHGRDRVDNPHFIFSDAAAWRPFRDDVQDDEVALDAWFHRGLGAGLMADGRVDELEKRMFGIAGTARRQRVMEGMGAAARVWFAGNDLPPSGWIESMTQDAGLQDWLAFGRGIGEEGVSMRPDAEDLGLPSDGEAAGSLRLGRETASFTELSTMVQVAVIPTPVPLQQL
jgi:hypothetical protein